MANRTGNFSHLPLPLVLSGIPKLRGGGEPSERTVQNNNNRAEHGTYIKRRSAELSLFWKERRDGRIRQDLPEIEGGIPLLLEIDPEVDIEFLRGLGFEIVAELKDGFIIVATDDADFTRLNQKVDDFIANLNRSGSPAKLYGLGAEHDRLMRILSDELYQRWNLIQDNDVIIVDVGVECSGNIKLPKYPRKGRNESIEQFNRRVSRWEQRFQDKYMQWDKLKIQREDTLISFVNEYDGEILVIIDGESSIAELPDSFTGRLNINGKCLKDLANNFGYIFEIVLPDDIRILPQDAFNAEAESETNILPPTTDGPIICVIDSGIQEGHRYLAPAILANDSICLLKHTDEVSDYVEEGGHGTRVCGAVLYPDQIPIDGDYQLPCWIRNIRILDDTNIMPDNLNPPYVIKYIVNRFYAGTEDKSKLYNHSIGSSSPCRLMHMSAWAAEIDNQSYENDILFIQAAGNVSSNTIKEYLRTGNEHPQYLLNPLCRVSNPAQSLQALTVGSISLSDYETKDLIALGNKNEPSSFTRTGPGIWDVVKPDVVEYGGTEVKNREDRLITLTTPPEVCPELIRVSPEGPAYSKDAIGTSFSTPKVTHIAAQIQKILPESPALLYRALIAQSARWPEWAQNIESERYAEVLRYIGYGIPNVVRATENNEYRITLITNEQVEIGTREAHIYKIPIPQELSEIGEDFEILIEVTLSYSAKPRRTRRTVKRYLSTWLEWESSRLGEDFETFKQRIFVTGRSMDDDGGIKWAIGSARNQGMAKNFSRGNGTLQKDWAIIKSHELRDAFCIAVRGHEGWGAAFKAQYALAVSFEAIKQDIPIYEPIRNLVEIEIKNQQEMEIEITGIE
ncbi:MAG: S8 family peptidase [Parabacteroides sp.]|nr:S8 family peptidase [Parabacteroides sp.]